VQGLPRRPRDQTRIKEWGGGTLHPSPQNRPPLAQSAGFHEQRHLVGGAQHQPTLILGFGGWLGGERCVSGRRGQTLRPNVGAWLSFNLKILSACVQGQLKSRHGALPACRGSGRGCCSTAVEPVVRRSMRCCSPDPDSCPCGGLGASAELPESLWSDSTHRRESTPWRTEVREGGAVPW
jgi:hypothetical protein